MRIRCLLRFCSYGSWRALEASSIEADGEWVRQRSVKRRECIHCGRRQERSTDDEWHGYHISAEQEEPMEATDGGKLSQMAAQRSRAADMQDG